MKASVNNALLGCFLKLSDLPSSLDHPVGAKEH
jgi:hypothetical protein